jgi:ParB-like chromosome segregation protein Spo0J
MNTELVHIDDLTPDPANARKHGERNLSSIIDSLRAFGQQKPIVVDRRGVVIAGNGTLEAAKRLGWEEIAVVRTELDPTQATAFGIADNRTAELAEWDEDVLVSLLDSLDDETRDLLHFDEKELEAIGAEGDGRGRRGRSAGFEFEVEPEDEAGRPVAARSSLSLAAAATLDEGRRY